MKKGVRLLFDTRRVIVVAVLAATAVGILCSRLVFTPVPWPDGSAFFLPGIELISWPPQWRMHAQAAYVPSYDSVNFNLMPALPIVLGIANKLGLSHLFGVGGTALMIKAVSLLALLAWAWLLWTWLSELFKSPLLAGIVALAGLWDPVLRWGTLVVRTETWIGLCWLWILKKVSGYFLIRDASNAKSKPLSWTHTAWQISAALALSAYFHFEAIFFVPAVIVALGFETGWFKRLVAIGLRTTLLLSPWLVYVLLHFKTFFEQMEIQFNRLAHSNHWMANPYMIFHSLFIEHGSPHGSPKFFNIGKAVFWVMLIGLIVHTIRSIIKAKRNASPNSQDSAYANLLAGAGTAFALTFYLWATKAEVWFITLCHLTFWPWVGLTIADLMRSQSSRARKGWIAATAAYAFLALAASIVQTQKISADYRWPVYQYWIDCIEQAMGPAASKPSAKIWQPHVPDVLVEISQRHPDWNLTRTLDFPGRENLAYQAALTMDAMVFTMSFNTPAGTAAPYLGPLRAEDRVKMSKGVDLPFGPWALEILEKSPQWQTQVCEVGPFWAAVLTRTSI